MVALGRGPSGSSPSGHGACWIYVCACGLSALRLAASGEIAYLFWIKEGTEAPS